MKTQQKKTTTNNTLTSNNLIKCATGFQCVPGWIHLIIVVVSASVAVIVISPVGLIIVSSVSRVILSVVSFRGREGDGTNSANRKVKMHSDLYE